MPVYKDKKRNTYYVSVSYIDALGDKCRHVKRGFESKPLATDYEANFRVYYKQTTSDIYFSQVCDAFLKYKAERVKPRSLKDFEYVINGQLLPFFEKIKIKKVNIPVVQKFQKTLLEKEYSNNYLSTIQTILSMIMKYAVAMQYIKNSPFDYIDFAKNVNPPKKEAMKFWTYDQFALFINTVDDEDYKCLFNCLYFTGMRISELQSRRWCDIDFSNNTLYIHDNFDSKGRTITTSTKNGSYRHVVLNKTLIVSLKDMFNRNKNIDGFSNDSFIFGTYTPLSQNTIRNRKDKYIETYNTKALEYNKKNTSSIKPLLPRIRIHDFRHSHVSLLLNNNVDSFTIAERLGHSKDMVERVYGHMFTSKRNAILNVLDNL